MLNVGSGSGVVRTINGRTYVFTAGQFISDPARMTIRFGLFRVDIETGELKLVSRPTEDDGGWVVDETGRIVAVEQYFERNGVWRLILFREGQSNIQVDFNDVPIEAPSMEGLSEDGRSVIVRLPDVQERPMYEQVSLSDGSRTPWRRDQDIDGLRFDRHTYRVIGGDHSIERTDYIWFEPRRAELWQAIKAAFPNATNIDLESLSDDLSKVIVKVFGPAYGNTYYYIDMTAHRFFPIAPEYDGITQVAEQRWIEYRTADGRLIHAYLTLPIGRDPHNLPLIVFPHGGPQARDYPGFDWLSQSLASLGYVVLQPEFRGSGGFGKDLLWAGFGEIGRKMQTDLSDGVRALAAQGLIDPHRVCIAGASYGGYAALAGATLDTGVYRCAVSISGVSDMGRMLRHMLDKDGRNSSNVRFWQRFLGADDPGDSRIDAINPLDHVDRITIPVLLIHGKDDSVVPFDESLNMYNAMQRAGKPVEFVRLEGEDHWMSRSATRLQMLQAMTTFLLAHNPPN